MALIIKRSWWISVSQSD